MRRATAFLAALVVLAISALVAAANEPGQLVAWRQVQAASNGDDG
jgi:hypothetical protein